MRPDMDKVIVERPRRYGHRSRAPGYAKSWQQAPREDWPRREGIGKLRGKTKQFNEHLSPLRRFLLSRVGRPWNDVFSEICLHLRQDSAIQSHVRDHLWDYVQRYVVERDGVLYHADGRRHRPLEAFGRRESFYVCPRTGVLRLVERRKFSTPDVIRAGKNCHYRRLRGEWYELRLREVPEDLTGCFDAWLARPVKSIQVAELRRLHGTDRRDAAMFCCSVRRVSRQEARKLSKQARELTKGKRAR